MTMIEVGQLEIILQANKETSKNTGKKTIDLVVYFGANIHLFMGVGRCYM